MTYVKQTWTNGDVNTPLSGPRMSHIENGIAGADNDVLVETGEETRPVGPPVVNWHDRREVQTVRPTNMGPNDVWWTGWSSGTDPDPEPSEAYNVFGDSAPAGTWVWGTDGTPYIVFSRGFLCAAADAQVVGGRVWIPTAASGDVPTEVTFTLFGPDADIGTTAVQTKVVSLVGATAGSWVEGDFVTPQDIAVGENWVIGVQFTGVADAGKYVYAADARPNNDAIVSNGPLGSDLVWASASDGTQSTAYKIGTGSATAPGSGTGGYGVDIKVTATV